MKTTIRYDVTYSNSISKLGYKAAEIFVGVPTYFVLSVIFCYLIIPMIITRHGVVTITKGVDEDRPIDWDPFNFISTNTRKDGLLDFYGFKNVKSKLVPLLSGIEQLGEASIQTIVSLIFITQNYEFISREDTFLGVPCPVSIISCVFSIVSLLIGFLHLSRIIRFLFEEDKRGSEFSNQVLAIHKKMNWR